MTDYAKKTVAELQEILKSRSLPHSGKKAELVSRLQEADKATESATTTEAPKPAATSSAGAEDEIDWDDDAGATNTNTAATASSEAGATLIAAGGKGPVGNPQAVPNQKVDVDPSTTDDLTVAAKGATADENAAAATEEMSATATAEEKKEEAPPAKDFSQGLKATDVDDELEKRKKRAAKFGAVVDDDKEAQQKLERAKRFGTATDGGEAVKGLDEALPERTRKRGRMDGDGGDGGRGGKRRDFGGRGRGRRRGGGGGGGGGGGTRESQKADGGPKPVYSEKDRLAAEARKKRFATTT
jgi:SAP domain-containing ribonucleoprotein